MTVLTEVICSTVVRTCLHNPGTIIGMYIHYVFIAKREERRFLSVLCTCPKVPFISLCLRVLSIKTYSHIEKKVILLFTDCVC